MSLTIPGVRIALSPGPRQIVLAQSLPATRAYIAAVEAADGQQLELPVLRAMCAFANYRIPLGGHCCIMAGARTLAGALVPVVGTAPTGVNLVTGDYSRTLGILGNGTNKLINTNVLGSVLAQNDHHIACDVVSNSSAGNVRVMGHGGSNTGALNMTLTTAPAVLFRSRDISTVTASGVVTGLTGISRAASGSFTSFSQETATSRASTSQAAATGTIAVLADSADAPNSYVTGRVRHYSLGTNLDLTAMNVQVRALMNALIAAGI